MNRLALPLVALLASAASAAAAPFDEGSVRSVLLWREDDLRTHDEVLGELQALGTASIPTLFGVTAGDEDALFGDEITERWWGRPDRYPALATEALGALPPEPVLQHIAQRLSTLAPAESLEHRLAALRVITALESSHATGTLFRIARDTPDRELASPVVRATFADALRATLGGDSRSLRTIEGQLDQLSEPMTLLFAETLGAGDDPDASAVLLRLLGRTPRIDEAVTTGIATLANRFSWRVTDGPARLRLLAQSKHPPVRRAALRGLGALADIELARLLVDGLSDQDAFVRSAAQQALEHASALDAHRTAADWSAWLDGEEAFWNEHHVALEEDLASEDPSRIARAARTGARHPLLRGWLAERLGDALVHLEGPAVPGLVRILGRLDTRRAVPSLIDLTFRDDAETRAAAGAALGALTGEELPAEGRLWERWANR